MTRSLRSLSLALTLLAAPAALAAQEAPAAAPATGEQAAIQGLVAELQQIHQQLQALQERALQDSSLTAAQEALGANIKAAMNQADPSLEQGMEKMKSLETEFLAAQQANDTTKQVAISQEAGKIQERFVAAQQAVMAKPELVAQVQAFQGQLEAKMIQIDPNAQQLINRFRAIEGELTAMASGK